MIAFGHLLLHAQTYQEVLAGVTLPNDPSGIASHDKTISELHERACMTQVLKYQIAGKATMCLACL